MFSSLSGLSYPFEEFKLVFCDHVDELHASPSLSVLGSVHLVPESCIDGVWDSRLSYLMVRYAILSSLAQQWFGQYVKPETRF